MSYEVKKCKNYKWSYRKYWFNFPNTKIESNIWWDCTFKRGSQTLQQCVQNVKRPPFPGLPPCTLNPYWHWYRNQETGTPDKGLCPLPTHKGLSSHGLWSRPGDHFFGFLFLTCRLSQVSVSDLWDLPFDSLTISFLLPRCFCVQVSIGAFYKSLCTPRKYICLFMSWSRIYACPFLC